MKIAPAADHAGLALNRRITSRLEGAADDVSALASKYTARLEILLNIPFSGGERHARQIDKIAALERLAQQEHTTRT